MSKRRTRSTRSRRTTPAAPLHPSPSIHDILEEMEEDSDSSTHQNAVSELLAHIADVRRASLSPSPLSPPGPSTPRSPLNAPLTRNHLVWKLGSDLSSIDAEKFSKYPDLADGWSRLVVEVLHVALDPLTIVPPEPELSCSFAALSRVRHALVAAVDRVDALVATSGLSIRQPCPKSCKPPPPPAPKPTADVGVSTDPIPAPKPPHARPSASAKPRDSARTPTRSYAQVAQPSVSQSQALPTSHPASLPPKPKLLALDVPEPVRLIVRFGGNPPQELRNGPQSELFRKISSMLDIHPTIKGVILLGAHWNKKGNIVVSFPCGTPEATVLALRPGIRAALHLAESVEITIDKPWSKLMVSSVPARLAPGAPVFSEADLIESFTRNPAVKDIKITRSPRWIRNPSNIQGAHSSFVFSFEDPDGSVLRRLRRTPLFVFGAPVSVKRWQETPKPRAAPRPTPGSRSRGPVSTVQSTGVDDRMETV